LLVELFLQTGSNEQFIHYAYPCRNAAAIPKIPRRVFSREYSGTGNTEVIAARVAKPSIIIAASS
jgi:hypothetical protein